MSELPQLFDVERQLREFGQAEYIKHTIKLNGRTTAADRGYVVEGEEIKYCEFRKMGLALVLIYLQRMLLQDT